VSVYKPKGKPYYHYDFIVRGLRFHGSTGTKNRAAAQQVEAARRIEAATGAIRRRPMTMNEAAERFYQEIAQHQASGEDVDRWLMRLVKRVEPGRLLSEIDDDLVARIVGERRADRARNKKTPVSPGTVNRDTTELLRRIMRRADKVWKVDVGEMPDWGQHLFEEPEERVREASYDEEDRIFASLRQDLHPIVRFAMISGCRLGECRRLTWADVDFDRSEIRIVGKSKRPGGKLRIVPMTRAMVALLQGCRGHHPVYVFTYVCERPRTSRDGTVVRRKGERYPISRDGWRRLWADALDHARVRNFRLHDTRHTSATRGLRASGNLKAVQKQLGHADIKTTAKYAHVLVEDIRDMMEAASRPGSASRHSPDRASADAENSVKDQKVRR